MVFNMSDMEALYHRKDRILIPDLVFGEGQVDESGKE
jgi:hypothetical protein